MSIWFHPKDPANPPAPAAPTYLRSVHLTVTCEGTPIGTLIHDQAGQVLQGAWLQGDGGGQFIFDLPTTWISPFGVTISVKAGTYQEYRLHVALRDFSVFDAAHDVGTVRSQILDSVILVKAIPAARPLAIRGEFFTMDGQPWTAIECSDFKLLKKYLDGENIQPILDQRRALGFNLLRVFGMCRNMWDLNPANYQGLYYEKLKAFLYTVNVSGLSVELSVFPDCALVMPNLPDQLGHWNLVCAAALGTSTLLELQNEADQAPNAIQTDAFPRPVGLLASHGSNGSQATPVRPWWDYETFHTNLADQWWRKSGHNSMEFSEGADGLTASHVPVIANENTRCPDQDNNLNHYFDAAAGAALLCGGSCFHSVSGKSSDLWDGIELAGAQQHVAGAKSVDLSQLGFPYQHRTELEGPNDLRVYSRGSCIVDIRK